jgi:hypothetical protein
LIAGNVGNDVSPSNGLLSEAVRATLKENVELSVNSDVSGAEGNDIERRIHFGGIWCQGRLQLS